MIHLNVKTEDRVRFGRVKFATALVGWGAVLWVALCLAPYFYAANDLIQWR